MTLGTIEKLPSGNLSVRLPRSVDPKRRRLGTFKSHEEAKGIVNGSLALAQEGQLTIPEGQTLRDFVAAYLDRRELRGLRDTDNARNVAKNHIEDADFIDWPVSGIRRVSVQDWLDKLQRKHSTRSGQRLSAQTVKNALNLLRNCLREAVERGLIERNPAYEVRLHRSASVSTEEKWTYLDQKEQAAVLAAVTDAERPCVTFAMWTGLRQSEQWCLRLVDVHAQEAEPHVVVRFGKNGKATKNGKIRKVPLFGLGLDAVKEQLKWLKGKTNTHGLLFPTIKGERRQEGAPDDWHAWLTKAAVKRRVRWHDLRHTCASSLISGWRGGHRWSLSEVAAMLGHSDIKVTQRYAHLAGSALQETVAITEAAIRGPRVDQKRSQVSESAARALKFLNRRSQVRLLSGRQKNTRF